MKGTKTMSTSGITPLGGVCSFPNLFTPRVPKNNQGDPRFSVVIIFNPDVQSDPAYKALKQAIVTAAKDKWGDMAVDMLKEGSLRNPLRDASKKDGDYAGYDQPGATFANFWTKQRPAIVDAQVQDVIDKEYVYPGCLIRVSYNAFAYDVPGNQGVGLGLSNVQVTDVTTPRLDGKASAKAQFDPVGSTGAGAGADDDLPF